MKLSLLTLCLISLFISSCDSYQTTLTSIPIILTETRTLEPSATFTPIPTETVFLTQPPTITPTFTPRAKNDPELIALFGEQENSLNSSLVFSPDGLIIAQANKSVKLWSVGTGELIRELSYPYSEMYYATKALFSPDGSLLVVNITDHITYDGSPNGHLLVWDVASGNLLQDWIQEFATMIDPDQDPYYIPVNAMAFLPNSTNLAYANGNKVEVKDARYGGDATVFSLGNEMYASELSIRDDAEFLYILMKWYKNHDFPSSYRWNFRVQIWHLSTKTLMRDIKYPEVDPYYENKFLVGLNLIHEDIRKGTFEAQNLSTDEITDFPYRIGQKFFNSNVGAMLFVRHIGFESDNMGIEIWNTDNWRNIYSFSPAFMDNWFFLSDVAFNPDNSLLAIDYDGRVSLWDIRPNVQP